MKGQNTIIINGQRYDAATGMKLPAAPRPSAATGANKKVISDFGPARAKGTAHASVHKRPARSATLNRSGVRRPEPSRTATSPAIRKFAPHPVANRQAAPRAAATPAAKTTPKPAARETQTAVAEHPNQTLKKQLIAERIAQAEARKGHERKNARKRGFHLKPKFSSIATVSLALLLLGGYLTYINLPNLSVRVAAAQAGIDASYPEYRPDGYSLNGPIAYAPGKVEMKFTSNGDDKLAYNIEQRASSWDSQAVLDNFVEKKTKEYTTYSERGLTIYTYDGSNAAWVNGGILYTVSGNAPLSSDQILRIASSL